MVSMAERGGRKDLQWCGFALFLVRFCGNSYFNSLKTLSGLQLLQPLSHGFRWKKVSAVVTLFRTFRTVSIPLFCKREASVLFYNASGFIISAYKSCWWQVSMYLQFRYLGKNQMRFVVFSLISVRFCGFQTLLTAPSWEARMPHLKSRSCKLKSDRDPWLEFLPVDPSSMP